MKIGRNDPCHCGSEKKYKKCCEPLDQQKLLAELATQRLAASKDLPVDPAPVVEESSSSPVPPTESTRRTKGAPVAKQQKSATRNNVLPRRI
ncbi:MAG: hypothetical protein EXS02_12935 [Planctomycetes bacterium]|nr:hypothetical protein [Planctomycetota bacterium]